MDQQVNNKLQYLSEAAYELYKITDRLNHKIKLIELAIKELAND